MTAAIVSAAATSSVTVLPAGVLTKIYMHVVGPAMVAAAVAGGHACVPEALVVAEAKDADDDDEDEDDDAAGAALGVFQASSPAESGSACC